MGVLICVHRRGGGAVLLKLADEGVYRGVPVDDAASAASSVFRLLMGRGNSCACRHQEEVSR